MSNSTTKTPPLQPAPKMQCPSATDSALNMSTTSLEVNLDGRKMKKVPKKFDKRVLVKPKTTLERIFGRKQNMQDHYFTDAKRITKETIRDVITEENPFKYPNDLDQFAYRVMSKAWDATERRKELSLKYYDRNTIVTRQQRDLLNRLYVQAQDVKSAMTILDIDSEFYSIVEGRPIAEKFNLTDYVENIRKILRAKIVTGYRQDDALLIEENLLEEQNMIDQITNQYEMYVKTFEEYLSQDHGRSMSLLKDSEKEATKANAKYETFREMAKEFGSLKSQVSNLEEKWRNCKMYQKFIYMVSPMHWRKQHDYYHFNLKRTESMMRESLGDEEIEVIEDDDKLGAREYKSLDEIIDYFIEDCKKSHEPQMYFKAPWELLKLFRFIELQNLNSLLHSEELAVPLEKIKESMTSAAINYDKQIKDLEEIINNLEGEIVWEEDRANTLETLARELINGEFRRLICDDTTLNLHVIVEDVYEARIATNDANLTAYDMMKAVELKYRELLMKLDFMPCERVQKAEADCYLEQAKIMKLAEEAARKLNQIDCMVNRLRSILEHPAPLHVRTPKERTMLRRPKEVIHLEDEPVTEEEAEYFYLFTDFCAEVDNVKEYRAIMKYEMELEQQIIKEHEGDEVEDEEEEEVIL